MQYGKSYTFAFEFSVTLIVTRKLFLFCLFEMQVLNDNYLRMFYAVPVYKDTSIVRNLSIAAIVMEDFL